MVPIFQDWQLDFHFLSGIGGCWLSREHVLLLAPHSYLHCAKADQRARRQKKKTGSLLLTTVNDYTTQAAIKQQVSLFGISSKVWCKVVLHPQTPHSLVPNQLYHLKQYFQLWVHLRRKTMRETEPKFAVSHNAGLKVLFQPTSFHLL